MSSTQARVTFGRNEKRSIALPDMAPFAGIFFLVVCFFLLTSRIKSPEIGIVSDEALPLSPGATCTKGIALGCTNSLVISCNPKNQFSLAVISYDSSSQPGALTQAGVIEKVAASHGITFTASEAAALATLPFLATKVEQISGFLKLPPYQRRQLARLGTVNTLPQEQLLECIAAAQKSAECSNKRLLFFLRFDTEVRTGLVMHFLTLLRNKGIRHPILMVRSS
ncbi:hypothetical protein IC235_06970 [Hymenobacter sp. BT664]|uniref:Biopolymer transporter ExbD n=1 Tax=Hymenobacter montanus TaxID=2771359 RepID=A0A927BBC9_9BACT|nr:hypothetical protein [Hymenobacter montanus]MBD2767630.1 hypothetical protein [Hymenobacter montanus]